ncbi:MAG: PTS sugar transporter subunit IIA [Bacteroidetes bacterium]|nr:PTS sugar transporter subunit IIA [Rhodothermia bacterium]MCS7155921.1 PTS sugar transporter subunit IIA [Bacteroidota bacterium]MCX7905927.1 PTS sugar transporter subunit IIA [Bacteroidota bacterium]MDW8138106.1 PTS sugar transporter subunit IIA [Bacteroidota bacterium]MDW8285790.1 PTS sugar transporter subunit IIA [Bacteroidota bacterium]
MIASLLRPEYVRVRVWCRTKVELLEALLSLVSTHPAVLDPAELRRAVWDREAIMSTGVGKGLAIPHGKTHAVTDSVASLMTLAEPVDYDALDGQPVRIAFLLVGPENQTSQHIKLLSRISRLMNHEPFRERLLKAQTPEELCALFAQEEELYFRL